MRRSYVLVLFFIVVALRLLAAQEQFLGDESYLTLRQVAHIRETGTPMRYDPLLDRDVAHSNVFSYLLASAPTPFGVQVFVNVIASSLVLLAYGIVYKFTKDSHVALLSAALSGVIPVFFAHTHSHLSVYAFVVPLHALLTYTFLSIEEENYLYIGAMILYSFLHPSVLVFVLGLLLYLVMAYVQDIIITPREKEISLFSVTLAFWSQLILYKRVFLAHGAQSIWQNLPQNMLENYFHEFTVLEAILNIDAAPLLFGLYAMRMYLFKSQDRTTHFLSAQALVVLTLLMFRLLPITLGLMLLGMYMTLLFACSYAYRIDLVKKSRTKHLVGAWKVGLSLIILGTAIASCLHVVEQVEASENIQVMMGASAYLLANTTENSIILAHPLDGQKIMALGNRSVVIDSTFLLVRDSNVLYEDVAKGLEHPIVTEKAEVFSDYNVDYILVGEGRELEPYMPAHKCLPVVYNNSIVIYKWDCELEVSS